MHSGAYVAGRLGAAERSGFVAADRQRVACADVFTDANDDRNTDTDIAPDGSSDTDAYRDRDTDFDADVHTVGCMHGTGLEPDGGVHGRADRVA